MSKAVLLSSLLACSLFSVVSGYGEPCKALNIPAGVCAKAGACPAVSSSLVNTCPDLDATCCSTATSLVDPSYSGSCVGMWQPSGNCVAPSACPAGSTSAVNTCPVGSVCCGQLNSPTQSCDALHSGSSAYCVDPATCTAKNGLSIAGGTCPSTQVCCNPNPQL